MDEALRLFLALAALPTPPGRERAAIDLCADYLAGLGFACTEDDAGAQLGGDAGNLLARLPGTQTGPTLLLNGHVDTVPPAAAIVPEVVDGYVVNREPTILGADNKASVAAILAGLRRVVEEDLPRPDLEVLITVQEEIGLRGAKAFDRAQSAAALGYVFDVDGALGGMVMAAPSQRTIDLVFRGRSAHAGIAPEEGRNAIAAAAAAIAAVPYGRVGEHASRNVGIIEGGAQRNIVPDHCRVEVEVRSLDDEEAARLADETVVAATAAATEYDCAVDCGVRREYTAYRFADADPVVRLAHAAIERAGFVPRPLVTGGGADAHAFNEQGLPCLNLASGMEAIHTPDERIAVADVEGMVAIVVELVRGAVETDPATDPR